MPEYYTRRRRTAEEDLNLARLEGDEVGDACDLGPRLRPFCGQLVKILLELGIHIDIASLRYESVENLHYVRDLLDRLVRASLASLKRLLNEFDLQRRR